MLTLLEQDAPISSSGEATKSISLDEWKIRELWCKGILTDLAYISFALELSVKSNLDVSRFASEWSVTELSDTQREEGQKPKTLKVRSVLNALCVLNDKDLGTTSFSVQVTQLSLFD
jgi:hypothetical protein